MDIELILDIVKNMSVIGLSAYIFSQMRAFKRVMNDSSYRYDKAIIIAFFSGVSLLGNYMNINVNDTLATTRPIGIITSGIFGGPIVGVAVGFISGIHRYSMGGYTAFAALVAAICQGIVSGYFNYLNKGKEPSVNSSFAIGILAGIVHSLLILVISKPFETALNTFKTASIPSIFINAVGAAIFINIINKVRSESNKVAAVQAHKVLSIANMTLPYLRKGLNRFSAEKAAQAIIMESDADAICITDENEILSCIGAGNEYCCSREIIKEEYLKDVLSSGRIKIIDSADEIDCTSRGCRFCTALVVPLVFQGGKVGGLMAFYYLKPKKISSFDVEFASGVGELLVTGLEIARLEAQAHMATVAEFKALQAQIQPHFLFNSLNTIASFCRTDPKRARELILNLSDFFRRTINKGGMFSTIEEELNFINSYLAIQKARFGERLIIEFNIPDNLLKSKIPALSIQPLVENSIKHGLSKKPNGGKVEISIEKDSDFLSIKVIDSGIGIPEKKLNNVLTDSEGIGLKNINSRLINLYGKDYGLSITSLHDNGTSVSFKIPG